MTAMSKHDMTRLSSQPPAAPLQDTSTALLLTILLISTEVSHYSPLNNLCALLSQETLGFYYLVSPQYTHTMYILLNQAIFSIF